MNRYAKITAAIIAFGFVSIAKPSSAQVTFVTPATGIVSMTETITNYGPNYLYSFDLTNISDTKPIWFFIVYSNANPIALSALEPGWTYQGGPTLPTNPEIYGPAGDPDYALSVDSGDSWPNNTPNGLGLGESSSNFWFVSPTIDTAPLFFVYDQEDQWAGPAASDSLGMNSNVVKVEGESFNQQVFTGGGFTSPTNLSVPEPSSLGAIGIGIAGIGLLAFAGRRKRFAGLAS